MSNTSDTGDPTSISSDPPSNNQETTPTQTTQEPSPTQPPSTQQPPEPSTSQPPPASSDPPETSDPPQNTQPPDNTSQDNPPNTTQPPASSQSADSSTTVIVTDSEGHDTSTIVVIQTTTSPPGSEAGTTSLPSPSSTQVGADGNGEPTSGLSTGEKIAVAVVVPIAAVALFFIVGLFFWKKRRARKDEEEQRKQDLKDYAYNPNDPTIPPLAGGDTYEMKEDASTGYRGWGKSTLAGSVGHKASTTMSGGGVAGDYIRSDGTASPEGEILGAMGPPASQNRGGDIRRGPSNASSRYSIGAGSEDSDGRGIGVAYSGPSSAYPPQQPTGYEQYGGGNPYADNPYAFAPAPPPSGRPVPGPNTAELGGQPVIRDNPSRRTTQIQNPPAFVPQPGISQNF